MEGQGLFVASGRLAPSHPHLSIRRLSTPHGVNQLTVEAAINSRFKNAEWAESS